MASKILASIGAVFGLGTAYCVITPRRSRNAVTDPNQLNLADRFAKYASVGSGTGTGKMTIEDFVDSVFLSEHEDGTLDERFSAGARKVARSIFQKVDVNGDGFLSYSEYCMFMSLLSTSTEHFRVAFHMFDRDENGALDAREFEDVVKAVVCDPSAKLDFTGAIMEYYFGPKKENTLSFQKFSALTDKLRHEIRMLEFLHFDIDNRGRITVEDLRKLLFRNDDRALPRPGDDTRMVSSETYNRVCDMFLSSDNILKAARIYAGSKGKDFKGLNKRELINTFSCSGVKLTGSDIDLMFSLFDTDNSGTVDIDELSAITRLRSSYYASYLPRFDIPQRNRVQQFAFCMQQKE